MTDHGPQRQPASVPQIEAQRKQIRSEALDALLQANEHLRADNERLQRELFEETAMRLGFEGESERLRSALEQYANESNWECGPPVHYVRSWDSKWIGDGDRPWDIAVDALQGDKSDE